MKIFKYDLYKKDGKWFAKCPQGQIIRTDYVNDDYYKGYFVWIIVNPGDKNEEREIEWVNKSEDYFTSARIGILEKQIIHSTMSPVGCFDNSGYLNIKLGVSDNLEIPRVLKAYRIHLYKTGQEILEPIENLNYIGFMKIWIKQELCLYCFYENV